MKQSTLKLLDFLSFGLPGLLVLALAIYASFHTVILSGIILMYLVSVGFLVVYGLIVHFRNAIFDKFPIKLKYNIMVNVGDWNGTKQELADEIDRTISLYKKHFPEFEDLFKDRYVFIQFKRGPFDHPQVKNMKVMGFMTAGGDYGEVAYKDEYDDVKRTAFAHELGHVIIGRTWGTWDEEKHHAFMKTNYLP